MTTSSLMASNPSSTDWSAFSAACAAVIAHARAGREAARRGIDLHVSATFPDDVRFAGEHKHDVVLIGALRARHLVAEDIDGFNPHAAYVAHTTDLLSKLREVTSAPILIDNLPEPTVQPQGLAESGVKGHRTRFRLTNVALAELASAFSDVYVIDVAAALAAVVSTPAPGRTAPVSPVQARTASHR